MSGQKSKTSDPAARRDVHSDRRHRDAGADVHRSSESDSRARVFGDASRSSVLGTVGSAQQRWPQYNRAVILASVGGTAAVLAAAIVRAVAG